MTDAKKCRQDAFEAASSLIWSACESYLKGRTSEFETQTLESLVDNNRGISYGIVQTVGELPGEGKELHVSQVSGVGHLIVAAQVRGKQSSTMPYCANGHR